MISGTWWVSTSNVYDEKTTYPVRAGTVAIDKANTVHWDGARMAKKNPRSWCWSAWDPSRRSRWTRTASRRRRLRHVNKKAELFYDRFIRSYYQTS